MFLSLNKKIFTGKIVVVNFRKILIGNVNVCLRFISFQKYLYNISTFSLTESSSKFFIVLTKHLIYFYSGKLNYSFWNALKKKSEKNLFLEEKNLEHRIAFKF